MPYLNRSVGIGAATLCAAVLCACDTPPPLPVMTYSVHQASRSAVVETASLSGDVGASLSRDVGASAIAFAPYPPPPKRAEIPPPAPSPRALWQVGHWSWDGRKYVWMHGRYLERPAPTANWRPGYWQQQQNGWVWVAGRWTS